MPIPIQDEPESTIGRKPVNPEEPEHERARSGGAVHEGDDDERARELRKRELRERQRDGRKRNEPPTMRAPEE